MEIGKWDSISDILENWVEKLQLYSGGNEDLQGTWEETGNSRLFCPLGEDKLEI